LNDILRKRICALIAMSYAIEESTIWDMYKKTNSVDIVLDMAEQNEF